MSSPRPILTVALALGFLPMMSLAQDPVRIPGIVQKMDGLTPVPNAEVEFRIRKTNRLLGKVKTGADGTFLSPGLSPGKFTCKVKDVTRKFRIKRGKMPKRLRILIRERDDDEEDDKDELDDDKDPTDAWIPELLKDYGIPLGSLLVLGGGGIVGVANIVMTDEEDRLNASIAPVPLPKPGKRGSPAIP